MQTSQGTVVEEVAYRHPESLYAFDEFKKNLNKLILFLEKPFFCLEDFNINRLKIHSQDEIRKYANMLF